VSASATRYIFKIATMVGQSSFSKHQSQHCQTKAHFYHIFLTDFSFFTAQKGFNILFNLRKFFHSFLTSKTLTKLILHL